VRKAICSLGAGPHAELLEVSAQSFQLYADRHGYDVILHHDLLAPDRPASWSKVPALLDAFDRYDLVFWIDADAAIVDASRDIADELTGRSIVGLVAHEYEGQTIPNCGVMAVRTTRRSRKLLEEMWEQTDLIDHKWWENAAMLRILGYELEPAVRLVAPTRLNKRVQFVDPGWNSVLVDPAPHPRINHYPGRSQEYRLEHLRGDVVTLREQLGVA
jgi:hypothetical protein